MELQAMGAMVGRSHPFLNGIALVWVFSAAISALSAPDAKSSGLYLWLYRFSHLLAANLDKAGLLNGAAGAVNGDSRKASAHQGSE